MPLYLRDAGVRCWATWSGDDGHLALVHLQGMLAIPCPEGTFHRWAQNDGMIYFWQELPDGTLWFPRGFAPDVVVRLQNLGFSVIHEQSRVVGPTWNNDGWEDMYNRLLNDVQRWAAWNIASYDEGVAKLHTRFGKAYCGATAWAIRGRPRAIVVTPRTDVITQVKREISAYIGEPVGHICSGVGPAEITQYTLVSPSSLLKNNQVRPEYRDWIKTVEAVYFDECHISGSQMLAIHEATQDRYIQWALSATPFTDDGLKNTELVGWFGPERLTLGPKEGSELGLIASMDVRFYEVLVGGEPMDLEAISSLPYNAYYTRLVVENEALNTRIRELVDYHRAQGDRVVVFVDRVKHGKALGELITDCAVNVGPVTQSKKQAIQKDFNEGNIQAVVVTKRWREGMTLRTDVIINAEGLRAEHVQEQRYGRGLLPKEDGRPLVLYDFFFRDPPRNTLYRHSVARSRLYKRTGWNTETLYPVVHTHIPRMGI